MNAIPSQLYLAEQVRELDRRAIEDHGIPGFTLMQRAAGAAFDTLRSAWPEAKSLHVLCGSGNNGGDGLVLAALALQEGFHVSLELLCEAEKLTGDALLALEMFREAGGETVGTPAIVQDTDVIVDALLGTGASRELQGSFLEAVNRINAAPKAAVLALDVPSGLHADSGRILGATVQADLTVSFIGLKFGLMTANGPSVAGKLSFAGLDVPKAVYEGVVPAAEVIADDCRVMALPPRDRNSHKNRHGHVLCIGGDYGTGGAIRLAAEAALRAGAGLVTVATRPENAVAMSQACPELMCAGIESSNELASLMEKADAVLIGPGLGQQAWGCELFSKTVETGRPLVVDADGLNLLAAEPCVRADWILTPHPGEAARLLGTENRTVQADRLAALKGLCDRYAAVTLLKGAGSLISSPDSEVSLCDRGNPGMAVGGMGDLLSGIIVSLVAQGIGLLDAARVAVFIHATAGDLAAQDGERGLLPSDLLPFIRQLVNPEAR